MGKPKKRNINNDQQSGSKVGLEQQINDGRVVKSKKNREKFRLRAEEEEYLDSKTSKKILSEARKQQVEINLSDFGPTPSESVSLAYTNKKKKKLGGAGNDSDSSDGDGDDDEIGNRDVTGNDFFDDIKINEEDERALEMFQNK